MARPRLSIEDKRYCVSYSISREEEEKLESLCAQYQCTKSEAIRAAISFIYRASEQLRGGNNNGTATD